MRAYNAQRTDVRAQHCAAVSRSAPRLGQAGSRQPALLTSLASSPLFFLTHHSLNIAIYQAIVFMGAGASIEHWELQNRPFCDQDLPCEHLISCFTTTTDPPHYHVPKKIHYESQIHSLTRPSGGLVSRESPSRFSAGGRGSWCSKITRASDAHRFGERYWLRATCTMGRAAKRG